MPSTFLRFSYTYLFKVEPMSYQRSVLQTPYIYKYLVSRGYIQNFFLGGGGVAFCSCSQM